MSNRRDAEVPVHIPVGLRLGGAFIAIGVVLFIFAAIEVMRSGFMGFFTVDVRFIMIVVAAAVLGAFATINRNQEASKVQVVALVAAFVLAIGSRFVPNEPVTEIQHWWLIAYAGLAFLCGLVIRKAYTR